MRRLFVLFIVMSLLPLPAAPATNAGVDTPKAFIELLTVMRRKELADAAVIYGITVTDRDTEQDLRSKILKHVFGDDARITTATNMLEERPRARRYLEGGSVILKRADRVERSVVTAGGTEEEIIRIVGSVVLNIFEYTLSAGTIIYSPTSDEVFGYDGVTIDNGGQRVTGEWFSFNRVSKVGMLYQGASYIPDRSLTIVGKVIKFTEGRFFADDGYVTTSTLSPPTYFFRVHRTYLWEQKKIMALNMSYHVGAQPFFYFPIFVQNYWGTGILSSFGASLREGLFVQNSKVIPVFGIPNAFRLDLYQKLGVFIGDEVQLTGDWGSARVNIMGAFSRKAMTFYPQSLLFGEDRIVNYFPQSSAVDIPWSLRYKATGNATVYLSKKSPEETFITLTASEMSDLYFRYDYESKKPVTALSELFRPLSARLLSEPIYRDVSVIEAGSTIAGSFVNRGSAHTFTLGADFTRAAVKNLSAKDSINNDDYRLKPQSILFPAIAFTYGGVIDPATNNAPAADIGYSFTVGYSHQVQYATNAGIAFVNNPTLNLELEKILTERDTISGAASMSRSFKAAPLSYTPRIGVTYNNQGTKNPSVNDLVLDKRSSYLLLNTSHAAEVSLPRSLFSNMSRFFEPTLSASATYVLDYKVGAYEANEGYGGFYNHRIEGALSAGFNGYGFLFVPDLNLSLNANIGSGYDLRIPYDYARGTYSQLLFTRDRISITQLSYGASLTHPLATLSYAGGYNILAGTITSDLYTLSANIPIPVRELFTLISPYFAPYPGDQRVIELVLNGALTYNRVTMIASSFVGRITFRIVIPSFFTFTASAASANQSIYAYVPDYYAFAVSRGVDTSNIFVDLGNAFSFDVNRRRLSNFKLQSVDLALTHEADGWEYGINFSARPLPLPISGSVKGIYWDKSIGFSIALKAYPSIGIKENVPLNSTVSSTVR